MKFLKLILVLCLSFRSAMSTDFSASLAELEAGLQNSGTEFYGGGGPKPRIATPDNRLA